MNKFHIVFALSTLGLTATALDAQACGESMFHSGQGMRYHAYITRQPADILIYSPATPDSNAQKQLYSGLEKAGHKITVITDSFALTQALGAKHYDVIIASAHDMGAIAAQVGKSSPEPALLAVLGRDSDVEPESHEGLQCSLREGDDLNQYLKSIDQTMRKRGT